MESKIIFSGFGGQGVLTVGQFVAFAALAQNKELTWMPSYGAEMRGGTANCSVVVSDKKIGSPIIGDADILIAMNKPSILKFESKIKPGGIILLNSSLVEASVITRDDITVIEIPATDLATQIGAIKVANMVMCGALAKRLPELLTDEVINKLMDEKFSGKKAKFIPLNKTAISKGREY